MPPLPTIKQRFTNALIFGVGYVIVFLFFIPSFTDGSHTSVTFAFMSVWVVVVAAILYLVSTLVLHYTDVTRYLLVHAVLLFIAAEIAVLIIGDRLPVFGLLEKYIYNHRPYTYIGDTRLDAELAIFRQKYDFAFSMTGLWAAMLVVIVRLAIPKVSKYLAAP